MQIKKTITSLIKWKCSEIIILSLTRQHIAAYNSELTWNDHITHIISRASRLLYILYRARQFCFSPNVTFTLYSWYIRTILEYAAPVWHPGLTQAQHNSLEKI